MKIEILDEVSLVQNHRKIKDVQNPQNCNVI